MIGADAAFEKPAEQYDRFVGRYGRALGSSLVERVGVRSEWRVLDVGCGPVPLTAVLAEIVGPRKVAAVDPSETFARACSDRVRGADVRVASAEELWDYSGEITMLRAFWDAAIEVDPDRARTLDEGARMPYSDPEEFAELWSAAQLAEVATDAIVVSAA